MCDDQKLLGLVPIKVVRLLGGEGSSGSGNDVVVHMYLHFCRCAVAVASSH